MLFLLFGCMCYLIHICNTLLLQILDNSVPSSLNYSVRNQVNVCECLWEFYYYYIVLEITLFSTYSTRYVPKITTSLTRVSGAVSYSRAASAIWRRARRLGRAGAAGRAALPLCWAVVRESSSIKTWGQFLSSSPSCWLWFKTPLDYKLCECQLNSHYFFFFI